MYFECWEINAIVVSIYVRGREEQQKHDLSPRWPALSRRILLNSYSTMKLHNAVHMYNYYSIRSLEIFWQYM